MCWIDQWLFAVAIALVLGTWHAVVAIFQIQRQSMHEQTFKALHRFPNPKTQGRRQHGHLTRLPSIKLWRGMQNRE